MKYYQIRTNYKGQTFLVQYFLKQLCLASKWTMGKFSDLQCISTILYFHQVPHYRSVLARWFIGHKIKLIFQGLLLNSYWEVGKWAVYIIYTKRDRGWHLEKNDTGTQLPLDLNVIGCLIPFSRCDDPIP